MNSNRDEKGRFKPIHGGKHERLYNVWCAMKERCNNPHNKSYNRYGRIGIKVCEEWEHSYKNFRQWAENNGYSQNLTIDRIDTNGNYEPKNCRWVTNAIQNRNYSRNHLITYKGETKCMSDWADFFGINRATVAYRLKEGHPLDVVFSQSDRRRKHG